LLNGLETIDWPQPLKDSQTNWIGRSQGASVTFNLHESSNVSLSAVEGQIEVFTTRPDTIFGASFMTLAPEHELVAKITTAEQKAEIDAYIEATAKRSERDRMADVKTISSEEAFADKEKTVIANSDFLNGLPYKKAVKRAIFELEKLGQGKGKINYRLRDAVFSRQRYWGEPFPVYYDANGMPQMIADEHLPIKLPEVEKYLPTETGEPPLGNATRLS